MKNEGVTFRRINGRVIPIRLSPGAKERAKGTAMIGGAAALAYAGGKAQKVSDRFVSSQLKKGASAGAASQRVRRINFGKSKIPGQLNFDDLARIQAKKVQSAKFAAVATRHFKAAKAVIKTSMWARPALLSAAAGLATAGAIKALSGKQKADASDVTLASAAGAGVAATTFVGGYLGKKHIVPGLKKIVGKVFKAKF